MIITQVLVGSLKLWEKKQTYIWETTIIAASHPLSSHSEDLAHFSFSVGAFCKIKKKERKKRNRSLSLLAGRHGDAVCLMLWWKQIFFFLPREDWMWWDERDWLRGKVSYLASWKRLKQGLAFFFFSSPRQLFFRVANASNSKERPDRQTLMKRVGQVLRESQKQVSSNIKQACCFILCTDLLSHLKLDELLYYSTSVIIMPSLSAAWQQKCICFTLLKLREKWK